MQELSCQWWTGGPPPNLCFPFARPRAWVRVLLTKLGTVSAKVPKFGSVPSKSREPKPNIFVNPTANQAEKPSHIVPFLTNRLGTHR